MYSVDEFGYSMLPDHAFQREGGKMRLWGGGKGGAPNPNPGMIASAEAAKEVAKIQRETAEEYLNFAKTQYSENKGFLQDIAKAEYDTMLQNNARAQEYSDYEKQTFRPLEREMVAAAREYNTDAKREQMAGQAKADLESQYAVAREGQMRELARYGINPNSGRFASLNQQLNLAQAADSSGAQNRARINAENLGYARMMDAAGMGRGLASNASTAYGVGLSAGNSAGANRMAPANYMGNAYNGSLAGLSGASASYGTAGNIYGQEFSARMAGYNAAQQASSNFWGGIGQAAGTVAGAVIMSSKDYKKNKSDVGEGKALRGIKRLDVEKWDYKDGVSDEGRHIGPYAEDFKREFGVGDGKSIPLQDAVGVTMRAVQDLAHEVESLKGVRKAHGGRVSGPGGPIDDKVPAMLSDGEYVIPADVVQKKGVKFFDDMLKKHHTPAAEQRKQMARKGIRRK